MYKKYAKKYLKTILKFVYGKKYKKIYREIKKEFNFSDKSICCLEFIEFYILIEIILRDSAFFYYKKELKLKKYFINKIKILKQQEPIAKSYELTNLLDKAEKEIDNIPVFILLIDNIRYIIHYGLDAPQ